MLCKKKHKMWQMPNQPHDSEDSLSQEHVATELVRLARLRVSATLAEMRVRATVDPSQDSEGGAAARSAEETPAPMSVQDRQGAVAPGSGQNQDNNESATPMSARNRQGAVAPESGWNWENNESCAPQRQGSLRQIPG